MRKFNINEIKTNRIIMRQRTNSNHLLAAQQRWHQRAHDTDQQRDAIEIERQRVEERYDKAEIAFVLSLR